MDGIILITSELSKLAADMSCTIRLSVEHIDENGMRLTEWYIRSFQTGSISSVLTALDRFENTYQTWGDYCQYGEVIFREQELGVPPRQTHSYSSEQERILREDCLAKFDDVTSTLTQWLDTTIDINYICGLIRSKVNELSLKNLLIRVAFQTKVNRLQNLHWEECHHSQFFSQLRILQQFDLANSSINTILSSTVPQTTRIAWTYPLKVLAIVGNDQGLQTSIDLSSIQEYLGYEPTIIRHPSISQLTELLSDKPWDIVVYLGHTSSIANGDDVEFPLNNNIRDSLSVDDLSNALISSINNGLQVFILISCEGTGFVRRLYEALELKQIRLPYVVVMRRKIGDSIANVFTRRFARYFFQDRYSIEKSVTEANKFMRSHQRQFPGAKSITTLWGDSKAPYLLVPIEPLVIDPPPEQPIEPLVIDPLPKPPKPNLWQRIWAWLLESV